MQAEDNDEKLVLTAGDSERWLVQVFLAYLELHVGHSEIHLVEEVCSVSLVDQLVHMLQRLH